MRLKKRNDCSPSDWEEFHWWGWEEGAVGVGGAVSAAVSRRVSRLWLNPRRLIFQQKYRSSAKGRDEGGEAEEQRRGVAVVERG